MALKAIASLFLLLIIATRLLAVFWPKKVKSWAKDFAKTSKNWSYAFSFVLLATGLIMLLLVARLTSLEAVLVSVFGGALLAGSFLVYNGMHRDAVKIILKKPDKWVQKVALLKVVVATILLWVLTC